MEENKEILQLLKQIEKSNRQQVRANRLMCLFAVVAAVCCIATFATIFNTLPQINGIIGQMQAVLGNLETTTEQLAAVDLQGMVSDVDALVVSGQQSLEQAMEKMNTIDFDALNQAIQDLAEVIEPMAKFVKMFG